MNKEIKKIAVLFVITFGILNLCIAQTKKVDLSEFNKIKVGNYTKRGSKQGNTKVKIIGPVTDDFPLEVVLTKGNKNEMEISANDEEALNKIEARVKDDVLVINLKERLKKNDQVSIHLIYMNLLGIEQSGGLKVSNTNVINEESFYIVASGCFKSDLELKVGALSIDLSGSSHVNLSGVTEKLEIDISGASTLKAESLKAQNAELNLSGASKVHLYVDKDVEGVVSGVSSLKVFGNAKTNNIKSSGVVSITKG